MRNHSTLKTVPGGALTGPATWLAAQMRVAKWSRLARDPRQVQLETLLAHCRVSQDTEFGRTHDLAGVRSYDDFRSRVPLRTYADFEPYLERMRHGESDVLYPGLIPYFGCSSGTSHTVTGNKYLPVSLAQIAWQQKAGFDLVARYITLANDRSFTSGYTLALLPPAVLNPEAGGRVGVGSNPGIMQRHLPHISKLVVLPRPPVRDIEDYDYKLTRIAEEYLEHDVRALTGTTCWFSVFFERVLDAAHRMGRKVETVSEIWPNLNVLLGGGVPAAPYRKIIDERFGRHLMLIDNYNATEGGIFACTERPDSDGLIFLPDRGVFFEFTPKEDHGKPNARRVPLWEVEPGHEYSVALSTASGLFGYVIGDFIRFESAFPHRMVFSGRASGVLSLTQELMTNHEIESAVTDATAQVGTSVVEYGVGAEVGVDGGVRGRYVFLMEFDREPADLSALAKTIDAGLCRQNRVYREHRTKDVAILPPRVLSLEKGGTRRFMEALGQQSVQQKFPRILSDQRRDLLRSFARDARADGVKEMS